MSTTVTIALAGIGGNASKRNGIQALSKLHAEFCNALAADDVRKASEIHYKIEELEAALGA